MTQIIGNLCYYGEDICTVDLWQCETCLNFYCSTHFHDTDKGENVECVACERDRLEEEETTHKAKFHIGDSVQLTEDSCEFYGSHLGVVFSGEIFSVNNISPDDAGFLYEVNECDLAFYEFELESV